MTDKLCTHLLSKKKHFQSFTFSHNFSNVLELLSPICHSKIPLLALFTAVHIQILFFLFPTKVWSSSNCPTKGISYLYLLFNIFFPAFFTHLITVL